VRGAVVSALSARLGGDYAVPTGSVRVRAVICGSIVAALILLIRCQPVRDPPPTQSFRGLPVSGRIEDARRAGFNDCFGMDAVHMRCRRHAITVGGAGPFEGAVDLVGAHGEGGFDQLILWHVADQYAVYHIADALEREGWRYCYIGDDQRGDQAVYTRPGASVRVSMDLSYYAKRRLRIIPVSAPQAGVCHPAWGPTPRFGRFGKQ
jgi:hypothetical protein